MVTLSAIGKRYNASAWFRLGFLVAVDAIALAGGFVLIEVAPLSAWTPYCLVAWIMLVAVCAAYVAVPRLGTEDLH